MPAKEPEAKFSNAGRQGILTVLNKAVAEKENEIISFFISRDDWRSATSKTLQKGKPPLCIDHVTAPFGKALTGKPTDAATTRELVQFHFNDYYNNTQNKQLIFLG